MSAITHAPNMLGIPGQLTRTALILPDTLTETEWAPIGPLLMQIQDAFNFYIGDWLRFGERKYGESYAQAATLTGKSVKTLQNWVYVCTAIEPSRRRETLDFSTHAAAAGCATQEDCDLILKRAEEEGLTVDQVQRAVCRANGKDPLDMRTIVALSVRDWLSICDAMEGAASWTDEESATGKELYRWSAYLRGEMPRG